MNKTRIDENETIKRRHSEENGMKVKERKYFWKRRQNTAKKEEMEKEEQKDRQNTAKRRN